VKLLTFFYHLSTQLTQVGLKVKVSKCKPWNQSGISTCIEIPRGYTLVIDGLCILGVLMGSQDFATHFLDEVLSQDVVHIDEINLLGNTQVTLGIWSSCVAHQPSYFSWIVPFYFSFLFFWVSFDKRVM